MYFFCERHVYYRGVLEITGAYKNQNSKGKKKVNVDFTRITFISIILTYKCSALYRCFGVEVKTFEISL